MTKLGLLASITTLIGAFAFATFTSSTASADLAPPPPAKSDVTPCAHKAEELKTDLVKKACADGGQPAAKDAMKKFMKGAKIKSCNQCHSSLADGKPPYALKDDAYDQFKTAGGK